MFHDICVVGVLGGPGAGKGTQCTILAQKYLCAHFSVGDLLRAELANPNSPHREALLKSIQGGRAGPPEINIGILAAQMQTAYDTGVRNFFLDGFPRKIDLAEYFEENVAPLSLVLVLECRRETLLLRVARRNRDHGDNKDNTIKRIETFERKTADVVQKYEVAGKVVRVQADADILSVSAAIEGEMMRFGISLQSLT